MVNVEREPLIEGPGVSVPEPIFSSDLDVEPCHQLSDGTMSQYDIYQFGPKDDMPAVLADWLRYRTLTQNHVAAEHERDIDRFGDAEQIRTRFLGDQGGRDLTVAVDNKSGRLYGVAWLHGLQNTATDFLLVNAGVEYLKEQAKDKAEIVITHKSLATIAAREYGVAVRRQLALELNAFATHRYFEDNPDCLGVVGRFGGNDTMIQELHDRNEQLTGEHALKTIAKGAGYIMLMATRQEKRIETQQFSYQS